MKSRQRRSLLAANFLHIFGLNMLAPIYALYGLKLGADAWQIGTSLALYNVVAGITNIAVGRFEDGVRRNRSFVITGYLITILAMALFWLAHRAQDLYMIQLINAVGVGIYMPAWKSLYTRAADKGRAASQWGMFDGSNMIAMAGAAALAGWLVQGGRYGWLFGIIIIFYAGSTLGALMIRER